eukprot:487059_1
MPFHIGLLNKMRSIVMDICNKCQQFKQIMYKCKNPNCVDSNCKTDYGVCKECTNKWGFLNKNAKVSGGKRKLKMIENKTDNDSDDYKEPMNKKQKILLFCVCRQEFEDSMIGCDECADDLKGWFHPGCVGISNENLNKVMEGRWVCPECLGGNSKEEID